MEFRSVPFRSTCLFFLPRLLLFFFVFYIDFTIFICLLVYFFIFKLFFVLIFFLRNYVVADRKSVVYGKSVDLGGRLIIKKKKKELDNKISPSSLFLTQTMKRVCV